VLHDVHARQIVARDHADVLRADFGQALDLAGIGRRLLRRGGQPARDEVTNRARERLQRFRLADAAWPRGQAERREQKCLRVTPCAPSSARTRSAAPPRSSRA
jgi:hypothetical protein